MNIFISRIRKWPGRALGACALALALIGGIGTTPAQPSPPQTVPPEVAAFLKDLRGHWHVQASGTSGGQIMRGDQTHECTAASGGVATPCPASLTKGTAPDGTTDTDSLDTYGYDFGLKQVRAIQVGGNGPVGTVTGVLQGNSLEPRADFVQGGQPTSFTILIKKIGPNGWSMHFVTKVGGKTDTDASATLTRSP